MNKQSAYSILLFYKYVNIPDAQQFAQEHLDYCKNLGIKGRILIADEGINGTLSGTVEQTEQYMHDLRQNPLFADIVFKIDEADGHAFKKMFVRYKKELVTFRVDDKDLDPNTLSGKKLNPKQFYEQLQRDDVIVLDGRTGYEYDLGHFRNSIRPDVESFREFPQWIREYMSEHKDKPILTYCTGGIRCEKLSGFLLKEGFQEVYQLDGGIVTYGKDPDTKGRLFDGKCYVFDERISVPINHTDEAIIVGRCHHCGKPSDRYMNCANDACHRQHICCEECDSMHNGYCSEQCASL
ncbi:oxygen-dependent tRNA uridine(34) hydroxylase TrhO [Paenibacillus apiarius]|uniref:tRNA uridine(34) hydroxylase n=1 Tax=Paenibacillus apiarius TaxID=46240 RepID=A0ABT4DWB4_9BACL|nr:rhodanese-related sulfurtransferase [Paenibacillus apiarius]MCY9517699.1 rhodanese-related sulfurtransferase [Paenibacillus apiarius]MCY9521648.1 rhodanese-related sulfurtransferase [Paenibacillus apiarius]MCY9555326.1 rhodanese-related sulfurtransferase [Paenibacillus apiarius]MCY9561206.1 rhodanese-related sulfurtransferase [Paenibacillus apiarius]MCY9686349.1 rhodanese-related sulfurtransferase [Paenibacillus apiarius]